jgi:choline monooxygenase
MPKHNIPILTPEELRAVRAPIDTALGLPGRAYFNSETYEAERRKVFAAGWMGAGFASEIPEPGDAKPVSIAGWELLLVRGADGSIRCFHNVCRHRGMKVIGEKCSTRNLRCPYHSWTYDLEGKLISTPAIAGIRQNESPGIRKEELGLLPVRCEHWFDVIFVNIDGEALPLMDHLKPVVERVSSSFDLSQVRYAPGGRSGTRTYEANWKIVLEGSIEDYHLPYVHKAFDYSVDYAAEDGGNVFAGFSSRRKLDEANRRYATESDGLRLPVFPEMAASGVAESMVLFVFPNTVLSCGPNFVATSVLMPQGPGRTQNAARTHWVGDAGDERYASLREKSGEYWSQVFGEDEPVWEALQRQARVRDELGLATRFSPHWERGLHRFQQYIADKLGTKLAPGSELTSGISDVEPASN